MKLEDGELNIRIKSFILDIQNHIDYCWLMLQDKIICMSRSESLTPIYHGNENVKTRKR